MIAIVIAAIVIAAVLAPQFWVKRVLKQHGQERPDLPGTGGELARHLLDRFGIHGVGVEATDQGDHYDPGARMVRLSHEHHDGRSLSAVAVATHEVGHAIQHHRGERGLKLQGAFMRVAFVTDKFAGVFFLLSPFFGLIARTPVAFFALIGIGIALMAVRVVAHLFTLPVEYDASFGKALPILKGGGYLSDEDLAPARSVLKAAALTYVAAALMSLLNLARWARILF